MKTYLLATDERLHPVLSILVGLWEDGSREWSDNLETPTDEAIVWQETPSSPSIGGLLLHMISCERYWLRTFVHKIPEDLNHPAVAYEQGVDIEGGVWTAPPHQPWSWYWSLYRESRAQCIEWIAQHNQPDTMHDNGRMAADYKWVLAHVIEHDNYHGGQLVMLNEKFKRLSSSAD